MIQIGLTHPHGIESLYNVGEIEELVALYRIDPKGAARLARIEDRFDGPGSDSLGRLKDDLSSLCNEDSLPFPIRLLDLASLDPQMLDEWLSYYTPLIEKDLPGLQHDEDDDDELGDEKCTPLGYQFRKQMIEGREKQRQDILTLAVRPLRKFSTDLNLAAVYPRIGDLHRTSCIAPTRESAETFARMLDMMMWNNNLDTALVANIGDTFEPNWKPAERDGLAAMLEHIPIDSFAMLMQPRAVKEYLPIMGDIATLLRKGKPPEEAADEYPDWSKNLQRLLYALKPDPQSFTPVLNTLGPVLTNQLITYNPDRLAMLLDAQMTARSISRRDPIAEPLTVMMEMIQNKLGPKVPPLKVEEVMRLDDAQLQIGLKLHSMRRQQYTAQLELDWLVTHIEENRPPEARSEHRHK